MKRKSEKITVDEAYEKRGKLGMSKDELQEKILDKESGERFSDLRSGIVFSWKMQDNNTKKLMSRLPNGKVLFLDWSENEEEIKIDVPYICVVYEPESNPDGTPAKQAYARVICPEYQPKIVVKPNGIIYMIWKDQKGDTRRTMPGPSKSPEHRIISAVKEMEKKGYEDVRLIFTKNKK
jgi:hypothetical protein